MCRVLQAEEIADKKMSDKKIQAVVMCVTALETDQPGLFFVNNFSVIHFFVR